MRITFLSDAFDDPPEVMAGHMNGIHGRRLAEFVSDALAKTARRDEIFEEDFGWAQFVEIEDARYFLAVSVAHAEEEPSEGSVTIERRRSLLDWLRGNGKLTKNDPVVECIHSALARHESVTVLEYD